MDKTINPAARRTGKPRDGCTRAGTGPARRVGSSGSASPSPRAFGLAGSARAAADGA
jgi:hypothetical protein